MSCSEITPYCECRFFSTLSGKYLGYCKAGELHPIALPFEPERSRRECGPFRHQERKRRRSTE